jgi:outer membrane lipoprotein SlyB
MQGAKTHPVVFVAGATVLLISAMGVAGLTGLLPAAASKLEDPATIAARQMNAPDAQRARPLAQHAQAAACKHCGVIESIRMVEIQSDAIGRGAFAGAAGGIDAPKANESNVKRTTAYRITLRMDDGTYRTLSQAQTPRFAVGERARIAKGLVLERE